MTATTRERDKDRRDSLLLLLLILLLGFFCIFFASGWALRFSPRWSVPASMDSKLNPNSDFLTSRPSGVIAPLDPSILTSSWVIDVFLTPGASIPTRQSSPTVLAPSSTPAPSNTPTATPLPPSATATTVFVTLTPTKVVYSPIPPTSTYTPTPTNTPIPVILTDLRITKTDGATTYTPGAVITYTLGVSNIGPAPATGVNVVDVLPAAITGITVNCVSGGGAACGVNASAGNNLSFTGAAIPVGGTLTITVNGTVNSAATGNLVNTATVIVGPGQTDPASGNNTATDIDTPALQTDLGVTKTDGSLTYTAGTPITYTITVNNAGPSNATGVSVTDAIPVTITGVTINCAASGTASCGVDASAGNNLSFTGVNIPVGAGNFLTITVNGNINSAATGNLANTATVIVGASQTDPVPGNNLATDTDTPNAQTDLGITKTDGSLSYTAGTPITYTITVANAGPSDAIGASVTDTIPVSITGTTINCVASGTASCGVNASAGNNLSFTGVNIPVGAANFLTITVNGTVSSAATGNLVNTAAVNAGASQTDPAPGNNFATDTDTADPQIDLSITKSDGSTTYKAGNPVTYTIVVANGGPSNAIGASVTDTIPAVITTPTINCVASGAASCGTNASVGNNLSFTGVSIPAGAANFITITAGGTVSGAASGNLVNTATVNAGTGQTDTALGNNTATDTDTQVFPSADLQITKTDGSATYTPGNSLTYTIIASNPAGPDGVAGATVTDVIPAMLTNVTWTCTASGLASCSASGAGSLNDTVNLPVGGSVTYTISATVSASALGTLTNTATITGPALFTEVNAANNSASDTDTYAGGSNIGIGPRDGASQNIPPGGSTTIIFAPPIVADGDVGAPDMVYFEILAPASTNIEMDWVQIEVSADGVTWYQVLFWGNAAPDTNTNIDITLPAVNAFCPTEFDNCPIPSTLLYNVTGITIDIDPFVPAGSYAWIRISSPPGAINGTDVDAIQPYYP